MTIALFASDRIPLSAIATNLRRAGGDVSPFDLIPTLRHQDITPLIAKGLLIMSEGGLIEIGEQTEQVRDLIGERLPLILCSPRSTTADREVLMECGASDVITPQSWNAEHVSERVLGQLILNGDITPNGCGTLYGGSVLITLRRYGHESSWPQTTTYRKTAARGSFATTSTSVSVASLWCYHP